MKQGYTVTIVQCESCKMMATMKPNVVFKLSQVQELASQAHRETKVVCPTPKLIIVYANVLVSNALAQPEPTLLQKAANASNN